MVQSVLSEPALSNRNWQEPDAYARLVASPERIGIYSPTAQEWVEVSVGGETLGRWGGVELPKYADITGLAFLSDQSVYVSVQYRNETSIPHRLFSLDKQSGSWKPYQFPGSSDIKVSPIYGTDGEYFILHSGHRPSDSFVLRKDP